MSANDVVLNLTYLLYVVAPLVRDELRLRVLFALASVGFGLWGVLDDNIWPVIWNALFLVISAWNIRNLMHERRPVVLAPELERVRSEVFPEMTGRQFERFWAMGSDYHASHERLTVHGEPVDHFWVFLRGQADVQLRDTTVQLEPNATIGGISYVRGTDVVATATVSASSAALHRWDKADLRNLAATNPDLQAPFLSGLARGLVAKIPT